MELADYVRYHERLGMKVIWVDGVPFSEYRRRFFWSVPRFREYDIGRGQVRRLLARGALGAIGMTSEQTGRRAAFIAAGGDDYGFARLQPRTRSRTRRGLENCEIRPVSADELLERGLEINVQGLQRQQRSSPLGDATWWRRQIEISVEFPAVRTWGAYVGDHLASYVRVIVHSAESSGQDRPVANIMHFMSDNEYLKSYPNEALIYTVTEKLLQDGCEYVVLGAGSDDDRLLSWKRHMGYAPRTRSYHLAANPALHVVKRFVPKLRIWMDGSMLGSVADEPVADGETDS